jgi:hypothetical protein
MENKPRFRFFSLTFLIGFGLGSFVGVGLALVAIALARPDSTSRTVYLPEPTFTVPTAPPGATATPTVRTSVAQEVRLGPGEAFAILGTIGRGDVVDIIGRDLQGDWVAIRFPPGSTARGWISSSQLQGLEGNQLEALAVVAPTPLARSIATPSTASSGGGGAANNGAGVGAGTSGGGTTGGSLAGGGSGGGSATGGGSTGVTGSGSGTGGSTAPVAPATAVPPTPTPSLVAGPTDLVVTRISILSDGRVSVVVGNRGPADVIEAAIAVQVSGGGLAPEMLSVHQSLRVGQTVTLNTASFRLVHEAEVFAIVDPGGELTDPNRGNNTLSIPLVPQPTPVGGPPGP